MNATWFFAIHTSRGGFLMITMRRPRMMIAISFNIY